MTSHIDNIITILLDDCKSVFLTGAAGTGKTYNTNKVYDVLKRRPELLGIGRTATTALAAQLVRGTTLHSYIGLPVIHTMNSEKYPRTTYMDRHINLDKISNIVNTEILIIDEVSMLSDVLFDLSCAILKDVTIRYSDLQVELRKDVETLPDLFKVIVSHFNRLQSTLNPFDDIVIKTLEYKARGGDNFIDYSRLPKDYDIVCDGSPIEISDLKLDELARSLTIMFNSRSKISKTRNNINIDYHIFIEAVSDMVRKFNQKDVFDERWIKLNELAHNSISGYIRLLMVGDLYQLRPIIKKGEGEFMNYIIYSPNFTKDNIKLIYLDEVKRQDDKKFLDVLNDVYNGIISRTSKSILNQRKIGPKTQMPGYIELMNANKDVDKMNSEALEQMPGNASNYRSLDYYILTIRDIDNPPTPHTVKRIDGSNDLMLDGHRYQLMSVEDLPHKWMTSTHNVKYDKRFYAIKTGKSGSRYIFNIPLKHNMIMDQNKDRFLVPHKLSLKIGARVVLMINTNISLDYSNEDEKNKFTRFSNGHQGTVTSLTPNDIRVKFDAIGDKESIEVSIPHKRFVSIEGNDTYIRQQYPLRLAYAITFHKSQGMTLNKGVVRLDRRNLWSKSPGMAYVALSRFVSLDDLYIRGGIYYDGIVSDDTVRRYYNGYGISDIVNRYNENKSKLLDIPFEKIED